MIPNSRPRLTRAEVAALVASHGGDPNVLTVVGIRGANGQNKRGVYDDEIYVISPNIFHGFRANTDPSRVRKGSGTGAGKGMAVLQPSFEAAWGVGSHRGKYTALIQIMGKVTVLRDGNPNYLDRGMFGINIHMGGNWTTSSLGCQTIPPGPDQWTKFITMVLAELRRLGQRIVRYLLIDKKAQGPVAGPARQSGTVNLGSDGARVTELQNKLNKWLAQTSPRAFPALNADGDFGDKTDLVLRAFQAAKGLRVDGFAGPKTFAALG